MPFLVRWNQGGGVTIRCDRVVASPLLSSRLQLVGVMGISDPDHPEIQLHTLTLRPEQIDWIAEGVQMKKKQEQQPQTEAEEGGEDAAEETDTLSYFQSLAEED